MDSYIFLTLLKEDQKTAGDIINSAGFLHLQKEGYENDAI
jgi:hypothetical protein